MGALDISCSDLVHTSRPDGTGDEAEYAANGRLGIVVGREVEALLTRHLSLRPFALKRAL